MRVGPWILLAACAEAPRGADAGVEEISMRVMSFNVRYGSANDGENRWALRRDAVMDRIRAFDPDLLGAQEVEAFQHDEIAAALPEYAAFGAGRNDGQRSGEMCAIYHRRERFEVVDSGHFWLSETPEVPGSKSWDSSLARMVSWLRLRDRRGGRELGFFNTHFDHRGTVARERAAEMLRDRASAFGAPVVVAGDFNTVPGSAPHATLVERLRHSYLELHPEPPWPSTVNGFGGMTSSPHIDWILRSAELATREARVDDAKPGGRFPSDHWPVLAIFEWR